MTNSQSIFQFKDPALFLRETYQAKRAQNPRYSIRSWARQLGLTNHSLLAMILSGKRRLLPELGEKVKASLNLDADEAKYFDLLILMQNSKSDSVKNLLTEVFAQSGPERSLRVLDEDFFQIVTDWVHVTVLEMAKLKGFQANAEYIHRRLPEVSLFQAQSVLDRFRRVEMLTFDGSWKLVPGLGPWRTRHDVPSRCIRKIQATLIQKSIEALEAQTVEEREFSNITIAVRRTDLPEAKEMLRDFRKKFMERFEVGDADEIYELGTQFFRLTEPELHA